MEVLLGAVRHNDARRKKYTNTDLQIYILMDLLEVEGVIVVIVQLVELEENISTRIRLDFLHLFFESDDVGVKQQQREEIDRTIESRLRTRRGVELQSVSGDGTVAKRSRIGVREDIGRGAARYRRRV